MSGGNTELVYNVTTPVIDFKAGTTSFSGEDPRLITENGCAILMVNDTEEVEGFREPPRRMYVHNLQSDSNSMVVSRFCHNMSEAFEKNWGPFYVDGILHFVYSVEPLVIGKVKGGCPTGSKDILCERLPRSWAPSGLKMAFDENLIKMRGGTPGIKYSQNEYLIVGHGVQEITKEDKDNGNLCFPDTVVQRDVANRGIDDKWHATFAKLYTIFFYTIALERGQWVMKRISCCSQLPGKVEHFAKIVFPSGIAKADLSWRTDEESYIVSFGEKDIYGGYCAMTRNFLEYILRPTEYWNKDNYVVDINYFENIAALSPSFKLNTRF